MRSRARARGGRVVAVGTTSAARARVGGCDDGGSRRGDGETELFITPGYRFRVVDRLLTNFHLPKITLLMLVVGVRRLRARSAPPTRTRSPQRYRFFSYGDAMLLERNEA